MPGDIAVGNDADEAPIGAGHTDAAEGLGRHDADAEAGVAARPPADEDGVQVVAPGGMPDWMPLWVTGAMLVLWAPGGFRVTCYYYRGAYYKAFWADPPSCAVGEPRKKYLGERSFPLIIQNIHRYFLYLALLFLVILAHDLWKALWFDGKFGIGVGTIVLALNLVMLSSYTFGCHSLRHLVGGLYDRLAQRPLRKTAYDCVSCFNRRHMLWAWCSLFTVGFSDLYVRMCAMGIWTDWRIL